MASSAGVGIEGQQKWELPGWRIEKRYDKGVLIGNWYEHRLKFDKNNLDHDSTHRRDFREHLNRRPDVVIRRKGLLKNAGLPKDILFGHHNRAYSGNMITMYDEHVNKRTRPPGQEFPPLRQWDSKTLAWAPEKTDYPLKGDPTNWGLYDTLQEKWKRREREEKIGDYMTTYSFGYWPKMPSAAEGRYANPRVGSTRLHSVNKINKNLHLRGDRVMHQPQVLQVTDPYRI